MSRDSILIKTHPEWFYKNPKGEYGNKIGDWSDVIDLDHDAEGLDDYLVSVLEKLKRLGIDGFRFDVATLIPSKFFVKARKVLGEEMIFLAECVDTSFILEARSRGFNACSNSELADAGFDLFYPYGDRFAWNLYYQSRFNPNTLNGFKIALFMEEANIQKEKSIVMTIENHDRKRIASYSDNKTVINNILTFSFFNKGPAFIYSGEEIGVKHLPSLFDKDTIDFSKPNKEIKSLISSLIKIKHRSKNEDILTTQYPFTKDSYLLLVNSFSKGNKEYGLFAFDGNKHHVEVNEVPEGTYTDFLTGKKVTQTVEGIDFQEPMILSE